MQIARSAPFVLAMAVLGAGAGLLYASIVQGSSREAGALYGLCIALAVSSFDRGLLLGRLQRRVRRLPTLFYIPATEAIYIVLVAIGHAIGGLLVWSFGFERGSLIDSALPSLQVLIYALVVSAVLVFVSRVRDLLGHQVFTNLLLGRYHKPVMEDRVFLFLDLVGSTAYARQHGDLRAQDYLSEIFTAIAEPVRLHKGAIDDYIGDMAMITWPRARGVTDARCIRCVFAILDTFAVDAEYWRNRFGQLPTFRAALHGGSVVTAEIGVDRHKISYFGDVVNTTARIETLCRELNASVLISRELLDHIPELPDVITVFSRGEHAVKEKDRRVEVLSLEYRSVITLRRRVGR